MAWSAARLAIATLLPFLAACQSNETVNIPITVAKPTSAPSSVPPPSKIEATPIGLFHKGEVNVGVTPEAAFKAFADLRAGGFESEELPPGFKEPYQARSWEDGQHGFGVILYNGLVAAAMYQDQKVSLAELDALVKEYESRLQVANLAPRRVSGAKVKYWFWNFDDQELMISGYRAGEDLIQLTECMGDKTVLDNLGISYDKAVQDQATIDGTGGLLGRPSGSAK